MPLETERHDVCGSRRHAPRVANPTAQTFQHTRQSREQPAEFVTSKFVTFAQQIRDVPYPQIRDLPVYRGYAL